MLLRPSVVLLLGLGGAAGWAQHTGAVQHERLLGLARLPGREFVLARLDPLSLAPSGPDVPVGEYHYAWSFSPDGSRVALALSAPSAQGRVGIRIVDVARMAATVDVATGIAAEALGWLTPTRLAAALQNGALVVVDTASGRIVHRRQLPIPPAVHAGPQFAATALGSLVILLSGSDQVGPAYLAVADAEGGLRTALLEHIRVGRDGVVLVEGAGLAVDADGRRAFVVSARAPIAEVDLETMQVRDRPLAEPLPTACSATPSTGMPAGSDCSSVRRALWLGKGRMAAFGVDYVSAGPRGSQDVKRLPSGVSVIDTAGWTAWTVPNASKASVVGDTLMVYGGRTDQSGMGGVGLRAYGFDGQALYHVFGSESVANLEAAGPYAYAGTATALRVIDAATGKVSRELPPRSFLELLVPSRQR